MPAQARKRARAGLVRLQRLPFSVETYNYCLAEKGDCFDRTQEPYAREPYRGTSQSGRGLGQEIGFAV